MPLKRGGVVAGDNLRMTIKFTPQRIARIEKLAALIAEARANGRLSPSDSSDENRAMVAFAELDRGWLSDEARDWPASALWIAMDDDQCAAIMLDWSGTTRERSQD